MDSWQNVSHTILGEFRLKFSKAKDNKEKASIFHIESRKNIPKEKWRRAGEGRFSLLMFARRKKGSDWKEVGTEPKRIWPRLRRPGKNWSRLKCSKKGASRGAILPYTSLLFLLAYSSPPPSILCWVIDHRWRENKPLYECQRVTSLMHLRPVS